MKTTRLLSVNLGSAQPDPQLNGHLTGIYKSPAAGPQRVTPLGLEGDAVEDVAHHGGPDQALYLYGTDDYDYWREQLGRELAPGTFGENLTIEGLPSAELMIGDILQVGEVTLQVTAPRIPCGTFAARMEDPQFVKKFRKAMRPGAYVRVLKAGTVQAGDPVERQPYAGETVTLLDVYAEHYQSPKNAETLKRLLAAPISIRTRAKKEEQLAALQS